jgi:antagonist of KipI
MGGEQSMIKILKPGLLTSVQDLGRFGYQKFGVIPSGVMDQLAHRVANLLVGNEENEATLEITLMGPYIECKKDALISICGGNLSPTIDGKPVKAWRPVFVRTGSKLKFSGAKKGCRAYLSVGGGFDLPTVMESRSTYLRAGLGGFDGRALQAEDEIGVRAPRARQERIMSELSSLLKDGGKFAQTEWSAGSWNTVPSSMPASVRVVKGKQFSWFSEESQTKLFTEPFEVTVQSDRMGYRLKGPSLALEEEKEMLSEAVTFGSIQVPAEGNPIVLLADRQTTGGYPKIGQIASVDLPLMAQLKPGDHVKFAEISHQEAQQLYLEQEKHIQLLKQGILLKIKK